MACHIGFGESRPSAFVTDYPAIVSGQEEAWVSGSQPRSSIKAIRFLRRELQQRFGSRCQSSPGCSSHGCQQSLHLA